MKRRTLASKDSDKKPSRLTLLQIEKYPTPKELYENLMKSPGIDYKSNMAFYQRRDRALVALLYLGDFRASEVLPLTPDNFEKHTADKEDSQTYINVFGVLVGKRKANKILFRTARLPLKGERARFTKLILEYLEDITEYDKEGKRSKNQPRLFAFSLTKRRYLIKGHDYTLHDGTVRHRYSVQIAGVKREWQIVKALLPNITQHFLRAFGYNYDYDMMDHDIMAVTDKTKADPRSLQPYLRRRYEKYPVA